MLKEDRITVEMMKKLWKWSSDGCRHCECVHLGTCASPRALEAQLLGLCTATTEALHLEPVLHHKRSPRNEKPMRGNERVVLAPTTREKPAQQQRPSTAINK